MDGVPRFGARDRKEGLAILQEIPLGCNDGGLQIKELF